MADLFSPVKRVQMKVGEYLAMEPSADRIIIERRPKCKPSRKKRRQRQARKLRELEADSVPIKGISMEGSGTASVEVISESTTAVSSEADMEVGRTVTEVEATPVFEDEIEKRPQSSQDSRSETRTVRILPTGEDNYDYWRNSCKPERKSQENYQSSRNRCQPEEILYCGTLHELQRYTAACLKRRLCGFVAAEEYEYYVWGIVGIRLHLCWRVIFCSST
jgi:hypothetical protein